MLLKRELVLLKRGVSVVNNNTLSISLPPVVGVIVVRGSP